MADIGQENCLKENKKPYRCDVCGQCFSRKSKLKKHIRTAQEGEKSFKCEICGHEFSEKKKN